MRRRAKPPSGRSRSPIRKQIHVEWGMVGEHLVQFDVVGKLAATAQQAVLLLSRKRCAYPATAAVLVFFIHSMNSSKG